MKEIEKVERKKQYVDKNKRKIKIKEKGIAVAGFQETRYRQGISSIAFPRKSATTNGNKIR